MFKTANLKHSSNQNLHRTFIVILFLLFLAFPQSKSNEPDPVEKSIINSTQLDDWQLQNTTNIDSVNNIQLKNSKKTFCERRIIEYIYEPKINYQYVEERRAQEPLYGDYETHRTQARGNETNYNIAGPMIGHGAYSEVYLARDLPRNNKTRVVKVLKETRLRRIRRELSILRELQRGPSIPALIDVYKNHSSPKGVRICLVFRLLSTTTLRQIFKRINILDIKWIMRDLLEALAYSHSRGIIHRDIKMQNIIVDLKRHRLELIDWGLAEYFILNKSYNVRVGSLHYKSPEIFLNNTCYDFTFDSWAAGVVLGSMMFGVAPLFPGENDLTTFESIIKIYGSQSLYSYAEKFNLTLDSEVTKMIETNITNQQGVPFDVFVTEDNSKLVTKDGLDLLTHLLEFDHSKRISPAQALKHPFLAQKIQKIDSDEANDQINDTLDDSSQIVLQVGSQKTEL